MLDLSQPGSDNLTDAHIHCFGQILFELADNQVRFPRDLATIRLAASHDQLQRGGLARAVSADQADALARVD